MKLNINGFEIEIKAKDSRFWSHRTRANKEDTMRILSDFAIYSFEASERYEQLGCITLSRNAYATYKQLYDFLEENEYFGSSDPFTDKAL